MNLLDYTEKEIKMIFIKEIKNVLKLNILLKEDFEKACQKDVSFPVFLEFKMKEAFFRIKENLDKTQNNISLFFKRELELYKAFNEEIEIYTSNKEIDRNKLLNRSDKEVFENLNEPYRSQAQKDGFLDENYKYIFENY